MLSSRGEPQGKWLALHDSRLCARDCWHTNPVAYSNTARDLPVSVSEKNLRKGAVANTQNDITEELSKCTLVHCRTAEKDTFSSCTVAVMETNEGLNP